MHSFTPFSTLKFLFKKLLKFLLFFFPIVYQIFLDFAQILPEFARIGRNLPQFKIPTHPGRIPDASGRIRNRYQFRRVICIWPIDRLLAHAAPRHGRPPAALRDVPKLVAEGVEQLFTFPKDVGVHI